MEYRKLTLIALFVTGLLTAQIISSKLLAVSLPVLGLVTMPGGTLAYAVTFFSTDCINELYGPEEATRTVRVAFLMNFVLLALVYATIHWPAAGGVPPKTFRAALGPSVNIVIGSLVAYLISQHIDVQLFDRLKRESGGKFLFARNIGSTTVSQFIDTLVFSVVAFLVAPLMLGVGAALPVAVIGSIVVGQFVVKVLIAVVDTPLVYLATR